MVWYSRSCGNAVTAVPRSNRAKRNFFMILNWFLT
jgi:hypothetical protein